MRIGRLEIRFGRHDMAWTWFVTVAWWRPGEPQAPADFNRKVAGLDMMAIDLPPLESAPAIEIVREIKHRPPNGRPRRHGRERARKLKGFGKLCPKCHERVGPRTIDCMCGHRFPQKVAE